MLLPSLIFSLIAAAAMWVFVRRNPATDPRVTGMILGLLLVLPLLNFAPKVAVTVSETASSEGTSTLLPTIWLTGFAFFSIKGLRDLISMNRWRSRSSILIENPLFTETLTQLGLTQKVSFRLHPGLKSPVVSGLLFPTVYLPKDSSNWSEDTLRMALLHELGHVQRRDLWMAMFAHFVCLLHWFNPAVWWLRRTFLAQCEYACDAHLLHRGADPKVYAHALCDVAESASTPGLALAMAGHVPLRERIQFLSQENKRGSVALSALIFLTAASAVAMSIVRFVPQEKESAPALPKVEEVELRFLADPFPAD